MDYNLFEQTLEELDKKREIEKEKNSLIYQIVKKYLGIDLYEGFNIVTNKIKSFNGEDVIKERIYYISDNGYIFYYENDHEFYEFHYSNITLADLFNPKLKVKEIPFQPRNNQIYYTINWDSSGKISIISSVWHNDIIDYLRLKTNLIFKNYELAEECIPYAYLNLVGTLPKDNQYRYDPKLENKKVKVKIE